MAFIKITANGIDFQRRSLSGNWYFHRGTKIHGFGFSEVVYKDAMEIVFRKNGIEYDRECELLIEYKEYILKHKFDADFVLFGNINVEVKAGTDGIVDKAVSQALNYLRVSGNKAGLIDNFGKSGMEYKRLIM